MQNCSKYFARRRPSNLGEGVKIQLLQNMDMLHINLNGITNAAK